MHPLAPLLLLAWVPVAVLAVFLCQGFGGGRCGGGGGGCTQQSANAAKGVEGANGFQERCVTWWRDGFKSTQQPDEQPLLLPSRSTSDLTVGLRYLSAASSSTESQIELCLADVENGGSTDDDCNGVRKPSQASLSVSATIDEDTEFHKPAHHCLQLPATSYGCGRDAAVEANGSWLLARDGDAVHAPTVTSMLMHVLAAAAATATWWAGVNQATNVMVVSARA
jgi:hypothetical protein